MGISISNNFNSSETIKNLYKDYVFQPPQVNISMEKEHNHFKIRSINGKLISCFLYKPHFYKSNKIIIWSHGNAMNCYQLREYYEYLCNVFNVNVLAYDYQGYGYSEGVCSEKNCYEDLTSVIEYVKEVYIEKNIYLIGQSLGTGVIIDYVSHNDWKNKIMLISPYTSIINVVSRHIASYAGSIDMFNSINKINKVKCPVQIIHGENDDIINVSNGKKLYEALPVKTLKPVWINNCDHENILNKMYELEDTQMIFKNFFV